MVDRVGLAEFLRHRREALQPEDVGLPRGRRRRTSGLRREEVAALCKKLGVRLTEEELEEIEKLASKFDLDLDSDWESDDEGPLGALDHMSDEELETVSKALVKL